MSVILALHVDVDRAAVCFVDGVLRCAVRDALLTRRAPEAGFPSAAIDAVLDVAGVGVGTVGLVVVVGVVKRDPLQRVRVVVEALRARPRAETGGVRVRHGVASVGAIDVATLRARLRGCGLGDARLDIVDTVGVNAAFTAKGAGLAVGAALAAVPGLALPDSPLWGPDFTDMAAYRALSNARLPRHRVEDAAFAASRALAEGETVVWARGPAAFLDTPLGPRMVLRRGGEGAACCSAKQDYVGPELAANAALLVAPDGLEALSPVDVVRAWRARPGARLILGDYLV